MTRWAWPVLVITSVLSGLLFATYVREPGTAAATTASIDRRGAVGGLLQRDVLRRRVPGLQQLGAGRPRVRRRPAVVRAGPAVPRRGVSPCLPCPACAPGCRVSWRAPPPGSRPRRCPTASRRPRPSWVPRRWPAQPPSTRLERGGRVSPLAGRLVEDLTHPVLGLDPAGQHLGVQALHGEAPHPVDLDLPRPPFGSPHGRRHDRHHQVDDEAHDDADRVEVADPPAPPSRTRRIRTHHAGPPGPRPSCRRARRATRRCSSSGTSISGPARPSAGPSTPSVGEVIERLLGRGPGRRLRRITMACVGEQHLERRERLPPPALAAPRPLRHRLADRLRLEHQPQDLVGREGREDPPRAPVRNEGKPWWSRSTTSGSSSARRRASSGVTGPPRRRARRSPARR